MIGGALRMRDITRRRVTLRALSSTFISNGQVCFGLLAAINDD